WIFGRIGDQPARSTLWWPDGLLREDPYKRGPNQNERNSDGSIPASGTYVRQSSGFRFETQILVRGENRLRSGNRSLERIPAAREGLNVHRGFRGFAKGFAQPLDGGVEPVIKVDECIVGPQFASQLLPGNDAPGAIQENQKKLKRLRLKLDLHPVFAEFTSLCVYLESTKAENGFRGGLIHGKILFGRASVLKCD